ncbi:MAG: hypothetical protein IE909_01640 [Campylobacterales bacterium]|nr:hypothetical protein [Campylobacterales bacterium]
MSKKILLFLFILQSISFGEMMQEGSLYKEKQELMAVKDELNEFYEIKELEYQKRKAELEKIHKQIKADEENIVKIRDENQKILDEINRVIATKSMSMYDKMKLGVVVNVFNEMIKNGQIDEVFDIMIRMKEKRVMKIMKKLDTEVSAILLKKMKEHEDKIKKQEANNG